MGSLNLIGLTSSSLNIGFLSAEIAPTCGIIFGILIIFILVIIAGFLVFKYIKNIPEYDEDRAIGVNKGIAKQKLDN